VLTIPEFREAVDRYMRQQRRAMWAILPLGCVPFFAFFWREPLADWFRTHFHPATPTWVVWAVPYASILALAFLLDWWGRVVARRDPRLICPHCDRRLFRAYYKSLPRVVATRKCDRCKCEVLTDPEPQLPVPPELTRSALEAWVAHRRRVRRWILASALLLFPLVACGLTAGVTTLVIWIDASLAFWGLLGTMLVICVFEVWAGYRLRKWRRKGVNCSRCHHAQPPDWTLEFEHCGRCGQRLVVPPSAEDVTTEREPSTLPPDSPLPAG
jgi:hypothetical protein